MTTKAPMSDGDFDAELDRRDKQSPHMAAMFAAREASRARAEEARLLKENAQQAATIKALADALYAQGTHSQTHGEWHTRACWSHRSKQGSCLSGCVTATAALRLAGRLP